MAVWAPLALITVTAALVALPIAPALYELRMRRDAAPLPTSRHDGRIENFAEVLRSRIEPLRSELEQCRNSHEPSRISIDGMEVLLVGADGFDFHPALTQGITTVMCSDAALIPAGWVVDADIYADGTLELGEDAALRAALGRRDIVLGKNSAVLRWLHADGSVYLRHGSTAYGRLSAGESIRLERGCSFQHMQAPLILTGNPDDETSASELRDAVEDAADADGMVAPSLPRIRIKGDFILPGGEILNANVIATGKLRLARGACLFGSAKGYKDIVLEEDACVRGSIVCGGTVRLGPRCFVAGPVMAEGDVIIARGSRVGALDALTTISSFGIQIEAGCQLHGTVWARVRGSVEG